MFKRLALALTGLSLLVFPGTDVIPLHAQSQPTAVSAGPLRYQIVATNPRLNRKITGPVTHTLHGVPAEPVDSMTWDGDGSVPIEGRFIMEVNPATDTGYAQITWTDEHGEWTMIMERFLHPEHLSGVRIGSSIDEIDDLLNEAVVHNVYLHGDTGAGMPVVPTVFAHIGAWGPSLVLLNGEVFASPYELPAPLWHGHVMVTEGLRFPDGTVRTADGGIYDPSKGSVGVVETGDLEAHVTFHDERFPRTANVPPLFSFQYHLVFEDVWIQLVEAGEPIEIDNRELVPTENPELEGPAAGPAADRRGTPWPERVFQRQR